MGGRPDKLRKHLMHRSKPAAADVYVRMTQPVNSSNTMGQIHGKSAAGREIHLESILPLLPLTTCL